MCSTGWGQKKHTPTYTGADHYALVTLGKGRRQQRAYSACFLDLKTE